MSPRSMPETFPRHTVSGDTPHPGGHGLDLETRIAELERKLNVALSLRESELKPGIKGEIQAILKGRGIEPRERSEYSVPVDPALRVAVQAPPLAPETPTQTFESDLLKFLEAIELVGTAATKLIAKMRTEAPETLSPSDDAQAREASSPSPNTFQENGRESQLELLARKLDDLQNALAAIAK